jgi:VWFA-related protein
MLSRNRRLLCVVLFGGVALCLAAKIAETQTVPPNPELKQRPPITPEEKAAAAEGRIRLDVVVTDKSGTPVSGLDAKDFSLQNNGKPQTIGAFHASDGAQGKPDSRVSLFLMIDMVNSGLVDLSFMRDEVERFLRQNGGQLPQPTTVVLFTDGGSEVVGKTSQDGNALADAVHGIKPVVHTIHSAAGHEALFERFQLSIKALGAITAQEMDEPGRRMLIWIGPGWPILRAPETNYDARSHELNFDAISLLLNHLREARMVLCSAGGGSASTVQDLMKPVKSSMEATPANLALQVLALESGGRTLDAGNRSRQVEQLNFCRQELGAYYTITFNPPAGEKAFSYHALKVTVAKPGLKVNTTAGYYAEP